MTVVDDRIILASWNGRPTVSIDVVDGRPLLHWLLMGHAEQIDLWLHMTLTWDQADELCTNHLAGFDLQAYLESQSDPIPARYSLSVGNAHAAMEGSFDPGPGAVRGFLTMMLNAVRDELKTPEGLEAVAEAERQLATL